MEQNLLWYPYRPDLWRHQRIQALDLLGRKVVKNGGAFVSSYIAEMRDFANSMKAAHGIKQAILTAADKLDQLFASAIAVATQNKDEINGCAVMNYLQAFGYVSFAYVFELIVEAAHGKEGILRVKPELADYYIGRTTPWCAYCHG